MKVALVTGASRGLGQAFAEFLAAKDYVVYAGMRNLADAKFKNKNIRSIKLDVTHDESIALAVELIKQGQGRLDVLINNAGVNKDTATGGHMDKVSRLNSLDRGLLLKMFDVNAVSPLMVIKSALPLMNRGGYIINISSVRASFELAESDNQPNYGYKASKTALNMLTRALVFDLPDNVFVLAVHPGNVNTDMNPGGVIEPLEAAKQIYDSVIKNTPKLNGKFIKNDGTIHSL